MRSRVSIIVLLCLGMLSAMASSRHTKSQPTRKSERVEFEKRYVEDFAGRKAEAAESLPDNMRFDRSRQRGTWLIMLQMGEDGQRVRFMEAVFSSGSFSRGKMFVYGAGERPVKASEFARLAKEYSMAAIPVNARRSMPVSLYRRKGSPVRQRVPKDILRYTDFTPISDSWGPLPEMLSARGVDVSEAGFSIDIVFPGKSKVPFSKFSCGKETRSLSTKKLVEVIMSAMQKAGEDVSKISDRAAIDEFSSSEIIFNFKKN